VIDDLIDVHVRAVARLATTALPNMVKRSSGAIINVASLLALSAMVPPNPLPSRATYAGAKAFMLAFSQALASELAGTECANPSLPAGTRQHRISHSARHRFEQASSGDDR